MAPLTTLTIARRFSPKKPTGKPLQLAIRGSVHLLGHLAPETKGNVEGDALEVRIGAQEFGIDVETRLSDDAVHGPAHGDPLLSQ